MLCVLAGFAECLMLLSGRCLLDVEKRGRMAGPYIGGQKFCGEEHDLGTNGASGNDGASGKHGVVWPS